MSFFTELNLIDGLKHNLSELGFTNMTPIQEAALPLIFAGHDVIGKAKTGSGKTLAFGLKLLNNLDPSNLSPQGIILCPTRELAEQVAEDLRSYARMQKNIKIITICGGSSEYYQEKSLSHGAHIIVATPGRVLKFLKNDLLSLDNATSFILDEADRMLDMGFVDDILEIEQFIPRSRQTLLFSATFPESIEDLTQRLQKDPHLVSVDTDHEKQVIDQVFYEVESHSDKNKALLQVLKNERPSQFLIFCKTKQLVDSVVKFLKKNDIEVCGIHGDYDQNDRVKNLEIFTNESALGLVATDVAARGLDIKDLPLVINYDLTTEAEVYIHRIGRTGRAGRHGRAISFFIEKNRDKLDLIEEYIGQACRIEKLVESDTAFDLKPKMKTLFISGGKKDKLRPGDILGGIIGECDLSADDIGKIKVLKLVSYVAIKSELADLVVEKLEHGKIKKRNFRVGLL